MRSIVGVGITPPKVLGTPNPASSVMISKTLGAPAGGTIRGAHQGLDCSASSLITPPNFGSGAGSCLPSMLVVAAGDPGAAASCAFAIAHANRVSEQPATNSSKDTPVGRNAAALPVTWMLLGWG